MIRDGRIVAVDATVLIEAYFSEADDTLDPASRQWQVELGGLCWSVRMLRWIAEKGVHAIPGSEAWILNFTRSIEALLLSPTLLNPA